MSILSRWALNQPPLYSKPPLHSDHCSQAERWLALDIFRDTFGIKADPEFNPQGWEASLELAHDELERDRYDMDQEERTGAPVEG